MGIFVRKKRLAIVLLFFSLVFLSVLSVQSIASQEIDPITFELRIVDSGENSLVHWLEIELLGESNEVLDRDRFRWVKATKRVLLNQPKLNEFGVSPPNWIPKFSEPIEANKFDYDEIGDTASRHFMRRQGFVPSGSLRGEGKVAWEPNSITKLSGENIDLSVGSNTDRIALMKGTILSISTNINEQLKPVNGHIGTVTTISASWDAFALKDNTDDGFICPTTTTDVTISRGKIEAFGLDLTGRVQLRFDVNVIGDVSVSDVDLKVNIVSQLGALKVDIAAYDTNGQTDPTLDSCSNRWTRSATGNLYVNDTTVFQSTGIKTVDLGTTADTDVEAARDSNSPYSLGLNEDNTSASGIKNTKLEALENSGTDEPKLVVTHS